ncbi:YhcN/YlaJ family sporulation lipoprotein [Aeribacillus sp. FSL M8-0254]|mgnify:FL=1|uniref:YhcN/YlaJ family sporulation lipoprotein n=1 Tax=Aeribacillus sp. FSL M8-0254 TaxID=2954577 RepID=UPI0030F9C3FD
MRSFLMFILLVSFILNGCSTNENAREENRGENYSRTITVKDSVRENVDRKSGQEIARRLAKIAENVPDVNDATAVVLGNYAVVGIDVDKKLDRSKVESIKYSVAESLKNDPYGAYAVVIADPDTNERIRQIGEEIQNGRPIGGILDELAQIVGRLMPDLPGDATDNQQKQPMNEKDQLPKSKNQELNKEQRDQSNQKQQ